jgi:hypothetical protein
MQFLYEQRIFSVENKALKPRPTANATVTTGLGSIRASSDTFISEGRQMKQCHKNPPPPLKNSPLSMITERILWIFFMHVLYSTRLHLPPLRFHCVGGLWDRTQDSCDFSALAVRRSGHSATSHPQTRLHLNDSVH